MRLQNLLLALSLTLASALAVTAQTPGLPPVPTNRVLAIGRLLPGATMEKVRPVLRKEVPDTVNLYLAGKIDQWYTRNDQNGVVFVLNCTSVEEAHALLEKLPWARLASWHSTSSPSARSAP